MVLESAHHVLSPALETLALRSTNLEPCVLGAHVPHCQTILMLNEHLQLVDSSDTTLWYACGGYGL